MSLLYLILTIFLSVFLESFFVALANFRIIFLGVLVAYKRINWKYLAAFLIVTSLISDIVFHYVLGTSLLTMSIPLILFEVSVQLIPSKDNLTGVIMAFLLFIIYYILLTIVPNWLSEGVLGALNLSIILSIFFKALASVVIYFFANLLLKKMRNREGDSKLRLK